MIRLFRVCLASAIGSVIGLVVGSTCGFLIGWALIDFRIMVTNDHPRLQLAHGVRRAGIYLGPIVGATAGTVFAILRAQPTTKPK
jgi:hypothetical protein